MIFRKLPLILLVLIAFICIFHSWIPLFFKSLLYGIGLSLKSLIIFILPLLIFGILFTTANKLAQKATSWIIFVMVSVCLSNLCSTMLIYIVACGAYQCDLSIDQNLVKTSLTPSYLFLLPNGINNSLALFSGLLFGIGCGKLVPVWGNQSSQ